MLLASKLVLRRLVLEHRNPPTARPVRIQSSGAAISGAQADFSPPSTTRGDMGLGSDAIPSLREDFVAACRGSGCNARHRPGRPCCGGARRAPEQETSRADDRRDPKGRTARGRLPRGGDRLARLPADAAPARVPRGPRGGETATGSGRRAPLASPARDVRVAGCAATSRGDPRSGSDAHRPPAIAAEGFGNRPARCRRIAVCPTIRPRRGRAEGGCPRAADEPRTGNAGRDHVRAR